MIPSTFVVGGSGADREQAIAERLDASERTAVILEGMPDGNARLSDHPGLEVHRIAAGCPCCEGNLILRVTLNRLLRRRPARLYVCLAHPEHAAMLRTFLCAPPYSDLLELTKDLHAGSRSQ